MAEKRLSVGIDVGTTSTQLVVSELTAENRAPGFAVPKMEITERKILYRSPVHFTPLVGENLVDGPKIREIVEQEYKNAGISRDQVDTGAVIVTGETSRRENAAAVTQALSEFAGDFVVATAGPDLESVLAAKGAGAVAFSEETGKKVLHMDIGGGTANLAWISEGEIEATGCLNVGGRLLKFDESGAVTYVSPAVRELWTGDVEALARTLTQALEMAAGLRPAGPVLDLLTTAGTSLAPPWKPEVLSFSGGVADCIETRLPPRAFGDLGPQLGRAIRESPLCAGEYRLGTETIRATVIGAGSYATQLSGSTVFCRGVDLPLKNCPVVCAQGPEELGPLLAREDREAVAFLTLPETLSYGQIRALGKALCASIRQKQLLVCVERDLAKALGQVMALEDSRPILCLDGLHLTPGSYLDVGMPVGSAMPVVIKTLIFGG